jgi:hypothetical protein
VRRNTPARCSLSHTSWIGRTQRGRAGFDLFFACPFRLAYRPILKSNRLSPVPTRSTIMGKSQQSNKEQKKKPLLNPKEKKAAKNAKKHAGDVVPLIPH